MLVILFWGAMALIVYTYVLFPAAVLIRGRWFRRPYRNAEITPTVSMIVVAHNEAGSIGAKLDNLLSLEYPRDKLEVLVASDGSTDATEGIVRGYAKHGVRLLALPRQGKISVLNAAVAVATGDVLVFSDANSMFSPGAIRALVRPLADPEIGGVAGDQRYLDEDRQVNAGERTYWSFDRMLKVAQSAAGSVTSATGAIYAIRRRLFRDVPPGVTDDFANSTGVIARGYRLVFASDAVAYEPVAKSSRLEFARKSRVITRGLCGVLARRELLNPWRHGFYALQLFSHKVVRRLVVFPLLILLLVSPWLWTHGWPYQLATVGQLAFYGCGLLGKLLEETRVGRVRLFALPHYFCMVYFASLVAALRVLRGYRIDLWEPQRDEDEGRAADGLVATAPAERSLL
ncbi:MAG TPA: glycosyltransferase family 2 protein [Thermoguttaceae bacterium]|nr:glycosyltransferase family 2 protein [Thermoguttaceae bacterium]